MKIERKIKMKLETVNELIKKYGAQTIYKVAKGRMKGNKHLWYSFFTTHNDIIEVETVKNLAYARMTDVERAYFN